MKKSDRWLVFALGVFLLVLAGWLGFQLTWKEEEIDLGYSEAAQKDNFLAVKLLLQQQGVESQTLRSFSILDNLSWQGQPLSASDTLVMINAHKMLQGERLDNLLAWVEQGGRVIVSSENPFIGGNTDTRDALLERFGLEVRDSDKSDDNKKLSEADESSEVYGDDLDGEPNAELDQSRALGKPRADNDEAFLDDENTPSSSPLADFLASNDSSKAETKAAEEQDKLPENHLRCNLQLSPMAVDFVEETAPLLIDYSQGRRFDYVGEEPPGEASDEQGLYLARFEVGEGLVIINSDNGIWENRRVDCHDHAYALWKLINRQGKVWFLINQEAPSLWTMLWRASPYGALAMLLSLALWLWATASRFGPILTSENTGRRSLGEHIHASSMLLWRRQEHPHLVTLLRDELHQHLLQHNPQFETWTREEQIAHLQTLTRLSATQVHQALFSDKLQHPQEFTEAVACLQTIRKSV